MTQTLPSSPAPDVNIKRSVKPNIKIVKFGDGYSQRASFGLNPIATEVALAYTNIATSEKVILENFAKDHSNGQAFYWTMPDESTPRQWHITGWEVTYIKYGIFAVNINIEENFDIL